VESQRRLLVILVLVFADVLLALAVWQAASWLQNFLGSGPLSVMAIVGTLPYVVVWLGLRAALGLYPRYGLGQVEELRRQTFALVATLTIVLVFAFASQLGGSISRVLLFAWSIGLLLLAPFARCLVKRARMRAALWGKQVVLRQWCNRLPRSSISVVFCSGLTTVEQGFYAKA